MADEFLRLNGSSGSVADTVLWKNTASPNNVVRLSNGTNHIGGTGNLEIAGPRPWADVRAFGAPTGSDDKQKFADALSAIDATGGILLVPPGTYTLSSSLTINKPVTIMGTSAAACKISLATNGPFIAAAHNVTFANITFTRPANSSTNIVFNASQTGTAWSGWRFEDCIFDQVALHCTRADRRVRGSVSTTGTQIVQDIAIIRCRFTTCSALALALESVNNVLVDGCLFESNSNSWAVYVAGSPNTGISPTVPGTSGVLITNSVVRNNTKGGISLYDARQCEVSFCVIEGNGSGVVSTALEIKWDSTETDSADRHIISGNRVKSNNGIGIMLNAPRCICIGNICEGNTDDGIYLDRSVNTTDRKTTDQCVVAHNICRGNGGVGINIAQSQQTQVIGNQCHGNTSGGIKATAPTVAVTNPGSVFSGNICYDNNAGGLTSGISVAGSRHIVSDNLTQDTNGDGATIVSGSTLIQRNGYGDEGGLSAGASPTAANWPVGVIVRNTTAPVTYWLRLPGTAWKQIT